MGGRPVEKSGALVILSLTYTTKYARHSSYAQSEECLAYDLQ
jgi:hypothetical protein